MLSLTGMYYKLNQHLHFDAIPSGLIRLIRCGPEAFSLQTNRDKFALLALPSSYRPWPCCPPICQVLGSSPDVKVPSPIVDTALILPVPHVADNTSTPAISLIRYSDFMTKILTFPIQGFQMTWWHLIEVTLTQNHGHVFILRPSCSLPQ